MSLPLTGGVHTHLCALQAHLAFHCKTRSPLPSPPLSLSLRPAVSSLAQEGLLLPGNPALRTSVFHYAIHSDLMAKPPLSLKNSTPLLFWMPGPASSAAFWYVLFPQNLKATTELLPRLCQSPLQNLPAGSLTTPAQTELFKGLWCAPWGSSAQAGSVPSHKSICMKKHFSHQMEM